MLDEDFGEFAILKGKFVMILGMCNVLTNSVRINDIYSLLNHLLIQINKNWLD